MNQCDPSGPRWSEWFALLWLALALFLGWACAVWLLSEVAVAWTVRAPERVGGGL